MLITIQRDVEPNADHEEPERPFGIAGRPQDAGAHIVERAGDQPCKCDPQIHERPGHSLRRRARSYQRSPRNKKACYGKQRAHCDCESDRIVQPVIEEFLIARAVGLRHDHRGASRRADHELGHHGIDLSRGAADRGQRYFADEAADNDRVRRVVAELQKG